MCATTYGKDWADFWARIRTILRFRGQAAESRYVRREVGMYAAEVGVYALVGRQLRAIGEGYRLIYVYSHASTPPSLPLSYIPRHVRGTLSADKCRE